jgi:cytochrome c-type biogenesis protein CcmH/NrfG
VASARLGDRAAAVEDLRSAVAREPLDPGLAERLVGVLEEGSGSAPDLCALREARARAAPPAQAAEEWLAAGRIAAEELRDPPRALAALEQALAARPSWTPALLLRARVLAASARPAEAVRDLAACLALGAEPAALAPIRLELAALYQGPMADPPRAMSHLNAVLAATPEHGEALARLAEIHRSAQNWPAAADALRRLLASPALGPEERVERLLDLAAIRAEGFADAPAAAALCEQALDQSPGHPRALELLVRSREQAEDPAALVAALERVGQEAPDPEARAAALRRAAHVLAEPQGDPGRAAALLRRGLEREPGLPGLREVLAEALGASAPLEAVEEHRRLLAAAPGRIESWRALFQIFRRTRAHDRAFVAAGALRFLQAADPGTDGAFYAENAPLAPQGTGQVLSPADWATLRHPADRGPLSDLIALVAEPLARLVLETPSPAPKARGGSPPRRLLEELCRCLDVPSFTLLEDGEGAGLALDANPPEWLRIGGEFARRFGPGEQRFLLGRAAARLKARNALADHLGPGRLGEYLAAAVRIVDPTWAGTGEPGEGLVRQVAKAMPRKLRRPLEELAPLLAGLKPDLLAWYAALSATADRTGLLLSGDVAAALLVALRDGAPPPPRPEGAAEVQEAVRTRPDLQALLSFAASEDHFRLRQKLKLAIA